MNKHDLSVDPVDFERLSPVPREAWPELQALFESGELFRYSGDPKRSPATLFEREFAAYVGMPYALGVNSCSSGIFLALLLCGVRSGTSVLVPAFTFTAVPGAIANAGGKAILVETNADFRMSIDDFERKAPLAKVLLLSHMRGYMSDMDAVAEICAKHGIVMIEDAAHALGSTWNGKQAGSFGAIGCFSMQSNKIINTGEGGMITLNDKTLWTKAVIMSGAYENLGQRFHGIESDLFDRHKKRHAPFNMRLDNAKAVVARHELRTVDKRAEAYRHMHATLVRKLRDGNNLLAFAQDDAREVRVPDSLQFRIPSFAPTQMEQFVRLTRAAGLPLSCIGLGDDNARAFWSWEYLPPSSDLAATRKILRTTCDMRLPSGLTERHLTYIANAVHAATRAAATA